MTQLRQYQKDFTTNIRNCLAQSKKIIACSATGSGKTKTFLSIADTAIERGTTVLILTEARKIFKQIAEERPQAKEIKAGIGYMHIEPGTIYVAMAQTLAKRPQIVQQLSALGGRLLIINDEAHIGTATKLLEQLPNAYLIGFTATPDYKVAKHLPKIYRGIVVGPQPQELVEMGFLSPYYHYERRFADLSKLQTDSKGEFTEQSQFTAFDKPVVFDGLLEDLPRYPHKKCLIFCSSIAHCKKTHNQLTEHGYESVQVHSQNPAADYDLHNFMNGPIDICVSVGILTKGFDFPLIDLVILLRATTSLALYCQMIGRGSRLAKNKTRFTVLDYGGNCSRHGLWNFEHDWGTKWMVQKKKKKTEGVAPIKECPQCFLVVAPKVKICPECGFLFPAPKAAELEAGELVSATSEYDKLRGKYISELTPFELFIYAKTTNKKAYAKRVAIAQGEKFLSEYAKSAGWKFGWNYKIKADIGHPFHNTLIK